MKKLLIVPFVVLFAGFISCETYVIEPEEITEDVSFATDIEPILNACSFCHNSDPRGVEPDFTNPNLYNLLINGGYVDTDNPESSRLYAILAAGGGHTSSTPDNRNLILAWIQQGAENN